MAGIMSADNSFLKFPPELLDNVFTFVDPVDLGSLALTCKVFQKHTTKNAFLFKGIYAQYMDEPNENDQKTWNWEEALHDFVLLRRVLTSPSYGTVRKKLPHLHPISRIISSMARTSNPKQADSLNIKFLKEHFTDADDTTNLEAFCCQSTIYGRAKRRRSPTYVQHTTSEERQASAKLHTYLGAPIRNLPYNTNAPIYPYAISMVYDLRNYTSLSLRGPFLPDGKATVDWEKMEAVMIVLGHNIREFAINQGTKLGLRPLWNHCWDGASPNSYMGKKLERGEDVKPQVDFEDPYGIAGTWMRVVTFLDFHELFHYNFAGPALATHIPRPPLNTIEAVRLIMMELRVSHKEDPGPNDGQDYPVVHFTGTARSLHASWDPNANSNIRGTVRQTQEGEIRWTSISVFNGEERWKSEGIQVGGVRSARGVLGHWFDKDWDQHGPAGPTAFWKVSDDIEDRTKKRKKTVLEQMADGENYGDGDENMFDVEVEENEIVHIPDGTVVVHVIEEEEEIVEGEEEEEDTEVEGGEEGRDEDSEGTFTGIPSVVISMNILHEVED